MPHEFPPSPVVYQQARRWLTAGVSEDIAHDLRTVARIMEGRDEDPSVVVRVDSALASAFSESVTSNSCAFSSVVITGDWTDASSRSTSSRSSQTSRVPTFVSPQVWTRSRFPRKNPRIPSMTDDFQGLGVDVTGLEDLSGTLEKPRS
ncbi:MAG: hypothetical protein CL946_03940 [Ectothiorhodospiraceae bacterium]|nr:hypothetical protein [Ectothiorhodospiraceae bacterium]